MKNKKIKALIASLFALSLGLSVTTTLKSKSIEPVSALSFEGEEAIDPDKEENVEEPVSSSEEKDDTPVSSEEKPQETTEESVAPETTTTGTTEETSSQQTSESQSQSEEGKATSSSSLAKDVLGVFKHALIDAWHDLVAHIKKWLKRN